MVDKNDMQNWLDANILKKEIIPAQPGFQLLCPVYNDGLPVTLSRVPIIAWLIQHFKDGTIHVEPITPEADEYSSCHAILYPNGTVGNLRITGMTEPEWLQYIIDEHKKDLQCQTLRAE